MLNPTAIYYSNRSACKGEMGLWIDSLQDAKSCVALDPTFSRGYYRMATAHLELNMLLEAVNDIKIAIELDPKQKNYQVMKAKISKQHNVKDDSTTGNTNIPPRQRCFSPNCDEFAMTCCDVCKICFYCSQSHQDSHYNQHKGYCTAVSTALFDDRGGKLKSGFAETICTIFSKLVPKDVSEGSDTLPSLDSSGSLSILFCGASRRYETDQDYDHLFSLLKKFIYPDIKKLEITLCGHEIDEQTQIHVDPKIIKMRILKSGVEAIKKSDLAQISCAIMICPGLSGERLFDLWTPAINKLLDLSLTTIVTSYSHWDRDSNDALFDEPVLHNYFGANIIIPSTVNCWFENGYKSNLMGSKNSRYFVFKDRREIFIPIPLFEFKKWICIEYMRFQGIEYIIYHDQPTYGKNCLRIVADIISGRLPYTVQTVDELMYAANYGY